jgi:hypothetical protein
MSPILPTWFTLNPVPAPISMRGLLGAIAADRHVAPSPRLSPGMVGEHQRAAVAFASLYILKAFLADKSCYGLADWQ